MIAQLDLFASPPAPPEPVVARATVATGAPVAAASNGGTNDGLALMLDWQADKDGSTFPEHCAAKAAPAPAKASPAPVEAEDSHLHREGREARESGLLRQLPAYFLEPEQDPRWRARRAANIAEWLAGWDAGQDPPPKWELTPRELELDALDLVASYTRTLDPATSARFGAWLKSCLKRKRECRDHYSAKEKAEHKRRKLDRTDVRRAYRTIAPRSFAAVAADAWTVADEYDRLCRDPNADAKRRSALGDALDELMIEANGGTSFGVKAYNGPKRLMKALRVRARAEQRWPMWGVEGRFRFTWRGLTMIASTRWTCISLDSDRHRPGTLCHSSTGFRSFSGRGFPLGGSPEEGARALLDKFVDGPTKDGIGLGGKLEPYQPWWMQDYAENVRRLKDTTPDYRAEHPAMTPEAERPAYWAKWEADLRAKIADAEARAAALGISLGPRQGALL
jgi:hypothetical protein